MGQLEVLPMRVCFSVLFVLASVLVGCSASDELSHTKSKPDGIKAATTSASKAAKELTKEQRCLALAIYWEAKGEGKAGMQAVGHVVVNRVVHTGFPNTLCGVTQQGGETPPCQFSWWCDGRSDVPVEPKPWGIARQLAVDLPNNKLKDTTKGAIFFHATRIKVPWKRQRTRTVTVGRHVFYK